MQYHALAVDYDGTLATHGVVDEATIGALHRLRESGRRLVLVTGRILESVLRAFPQVGLCDLVVADNGALLYNPETDEKWPLADPPPPRFLEELLRRGVPPLEIGDVVVATWEPHETTVLETIRDLGLELSIIFNKGAVMVLPSGVNKASGLREALKRLGLSPHNAVGIGDAENDEAFLKLCAASVAVENALDVVKSRADIVTRASRGAGVEELIELLLANDLSELRTLPSHCIPLGTYLSGEDLLVPVYGTRVLLTGESAGGKSRVAKAMLEQLVERGYQTCVIDPEGDYQGTPNTVVLGTLDQTPAAEEVLQVLEDPTKSCVISLFGTPKDKQPEVFAGLLRALLEHRGKTGRPHWFLIDEAHYPLSAKWQPVEDLPLEDLRSVMYITVVPDRLPERILRSADLFITIAEEPAKQLAEYCELLGEAPPELPPHDDDEEHRAIAWWRGVSPPAWFERTAPSGEHKRHKHSYLDGEMAEDHRFYFRGPAAKLNLGAQNLRAFMEVGQGVDDETWLYHLRRGDYATWFRENLHDEDLAGRAEELRRGDPSADDSRRLLFDLIRKKYEFAG